MKGLEPKMASRCTWLLEGQHDAKAEQSRHAFLWTFHIQALCTCHEHYTGVFSSLERVRSKTKEASYLGGVHERNSSKRHLWYRETLGCRPFLVAKRSVASILPLVCSFFPFSLYTCGILGSFLIFLMLIVSGRSQWYHMCLCHSGESWIFSAW